MQVDERLHNVGRHPAQSIVIVTKKLGHLHCEIQSVLGRGTDDVVREVDGWEARVPDRRSVPIPGEQRVRRPHARQGIGTRPDAADDRAWGCGQYVPILLGWVDRVARPGSPAGDVTDRGAFAGAPAPPFIPGMCCRCNGVRAMRTVSANRRTVRLVASRRR